MCVETYEKYSTIVKKYPTFRNDAINGCWKWLGGRRQDDNAEGLWRVHDKLYNLKDFVKIHPGGREWLDFTQGTDISEAFEGYHITNLASQILSKYFVRDALEPRNYRLTFDENGFYRTLKRRAAEKMKNLNRSSVWKSKVIIDVDIFVLFFTAVLMIRFENSSMKYLMLFISAQCMGWLNTLAHNFIHQRNNWRMYFSNITLTGWREWRVFHGLSHHLYPNSLADWEITGYQPFFEWLPVKKSSIKVFISYIATPLVYAFMFHGILFSRWFGYLFSKRQKFSFDEFLPLTLPLAMLLFGNPDFSRQNIYWILEQWTLIVIFGSFLYSVVAVNAGHHGVKIIHEGDEFRSLDFGIYQLGATIDRIEAGSNLFMTLTHFGDHILHHMFPSLDHALLPQFRDILIETCEQFKIEIREYTMLEALVDQFKQLKRSKTINL